MSNQPFLTIASFPGQVIDFYCMRCGRKGVHAKRRLARTYGGDTGIPELLRKLSKDCSVRDTDGEACCHAAVRLPGSPLINPTDRPLHLVSSVRRR